MPDLPKPIAATWARSTVISAITAGQMILGVAISAPASAAPQPGYGEIIGTITEAATGAPISAANVDIFRVLANELDYYDSAPANSAGFYDLDLQPGVYRICFSDVWWSPSDHVPTCFGGDSPASAADIVLGDGDTEIINVALESQPTISGTVTRPDGTPLAGIAVTSEMFSESHDELYWLDRTTTAADGSYTVAGSTGEVILHFESPTDEYQPEYWDDQPVVDTATGINLGAGEHITGKDAVLARTAGISGTVLLPEGAQSRDRQVRIRDAVTDAVVSRATVNSDGSYVAWGLSAGSYRVEFARVSGPAVAAAEFWDDAAEGAPGDADLVTLDDRELREGVDAALARGGTISGVVMNTHGEPVIHCYVQAYTSDGQLVTRGGSTDEAGEFSIGGLATGDYLLKVNQADSQSCDGGDQFAVGSGGAMSTDADDAVALSVTVGEITILDDPLVYTRGGMVEGTIDLPAGATSVDRAITLLDAATGDVVSRGGMWQSGPEDGNTYHYLVGGLPTGTYKLAFGRISGSALSAATFHEGVAQGAGFSAGENIHVVAGDTTAVRPATAPLGSTLTGKVVNAAGEPLSGCVVQAFTTDDSLVTRTDRTDSTGAFVVTGLSAGDYLVRVSTAGSCRGGVQYLQSGTGALIGQRPAADAVTMPASGNIEVAPQLVYADGVSISGTITVPEALEGDWVPIRLVDVATGDIVDGGWVGESAEYSFTELAASTYRIEIARDSITTMAAAAFFDNVDEGAGTEAANEITLAPGEERTDVDQTLKLGGTVDAVLVDAEGSPQESCSMTAHRPDGTLTSRGGFTFSGGEIWLKGLTTGDYRLSVRCGGVTRHYTGERYLSLDEADATTFHATLGEPATIDQSLVFGDAPTPVVENTAAPEISDTTPEVGQELTASEGTWDPAPDSVTYQWLADGEPIADATGATYTPVAGDEGKALAVEVTALKDGHTSASSTSDPTEAVEPEPVPTALENVTAPVTNPSTPKVGDTLTATPGTWSETPDSVSFRWFANGGEIAGATGETLTLTGAQAFQTITVAASASKAGYTDAIAASAATDQVAPGAFTNTAPATVSGAHAVGQTLTANLGTWTPTPASYIYAWLVGGVPVDGATGPTFVVPESAQGKGVQVIVGAQGSGYVTATSWSAPVMIPVVVAPPGAFAFGGEPRIAGVNRVRRVLRYIAPSISPAPSSVTYQWLRNGAPIATATRPTYRVRYRDRRKVISLRITYAAMGYTTVVKLTNGKRIR